LIGPTGGLAFAISIEGGLPCGTDPLTIQQATKQYEAWLAHRTPLVRADLTFKYVQLVRAFLFPAPRIDRH
jgi:hypothetical protein